MGEKLMPFNIEFIHNITIVRTFNAQTYTYVMHMIYHLDGISFFPRMMKRIKIQNKPKQKNEAVNFTNQNKCEYCMRACIFRICVDKYVRVMMGADVLIAADSGLKQLELIV